MVITDLLGGFVTSGRFLPQPLHSIWSFANGRTHSFEAGTRWPTEARAHPPGGWIANFSVRIIPDHHKPRCRTPSFGYNVLL
jgi:hypothetical protein